MFIQSVVKSGLLSGLLFLIERTEAGWDGLGSVAKYYSDEGGLVVLVLVAVLSFESGLDFAVYNSLDLVEEGSTNAVLR